jgi:hypothetical protein
VSRHLVILSILIVSACGVDSSGETAQPDAGCPVADRACTPQFTCNQWRAMTEPAPFTEAAIPGDVSLLDDQDFYVCPYDMPPISDITWTTGPLRQTGPNASLQVGAIVVRQVGAQLECEWRAAVAVREVATGQCDPSEGAQ